MINSIVFLVRQRENMRPSKSSLCVFARHCLYHCQPETNVLSLHRRQDVCVRMVGHVFEKISSSLGVILCFPFLFSDEISSRRARASVTIARELLTLAND